MQKYQPKTVVLGGGGMKGLLELGALGVLEKEGVLNSVERYVGVSVGAIIALLKIIGYTTTEICTRAIETRIFSGLQDIDITKVGERCGLIASDHIKAVIQDMVEKKLGFVPNLHHLYHMTGVEYVAVTYDLKAARSVHLSYLTEPELDCVLASMMSANIALLFHSITYKEMTCVDGGYYDPFPVRPYDNGKDEVLVITINSQIAPDFQKNICSYAYRVIQCQMIAHTQKDKREISAKCRHLELSTSCCDTVGFTVDAKDKAKMIIDGYDQCRSFLGITPS